MSPLRRLASRRQVLGGGLALATLQAPFVRARAAAPIRIGFPIPLTGPYQEEALDMLRGGHVAVAMFNAQGELGGQTAELVTRDDELNSAKAADVTRGLIANDHVAFITGGLSASVQLAINQVTKAAKVLFNSISQSDAIVAMPNCSPYTFHEALTPHMTSQAVGRYVFSNYLKRIAFLVADYAFGNEIVAGFEAVGKQFGIEIVATVRHPLGTLDFRPYLEQIQVAKPNVLVLCNFGFDQRNSVQQADWMGTQAQHEVGDAGAGLYAASRRRSGSVSGGPWWFVILLAARRHGCQRTAVQRPLPRDERRPGAIRLWRARLRRGHDGTHRRESAGSIATDKLVAAMQDMKYDLAKNSSTTARAITRQCSRRWSWTASSPPARTIWTCSGSCGSIRPTRQF